MVGKTLGHYEILEPLGAGGMGEVYLAEDPRLGRKVAIKVLPAEFASDPERLARFEQEARAAAALNHPHIAVVHDIGAEGDTHFMVQEYLEGQSLRQRLDKGAMPVDKALDLAIEVGEALAAAHKAGIIHRDLKPDNVFVTEEGHAKVLDFGLAKLTEPTAASDLASMSPTMLGTVAGQVLGTAGYMAPEQINGEEVDQRADLFAFGCVLYGMVTGRQAFSGNNVHETLGRILSEEPLPITDIHESAPPELQRIIRKALAKDADRRYQTAVDLNIDLRRLRDDLVSGVAVPSAARAASVGAGASADAPRGPGWATAGVVAIITGMAIGAVVWALMRGQPSTPGTSARFSIPPPPGVSFGGSGNQLAVSPNGESIVFRGREGESFQLYVRRLDQLGAAPLEGTTGATRPFFSPDGESVAFNVDDDLKVVSLAGGAPFTLCEDCASGGSDGTWHGNTIIFDQDGMLWQIPATGAVLPTLVAEPNTERGETQYDRPDFLPTGQAIVFEIRRADTPLLAEGSIAALDLESEELTVLAEEGADPVYLSSGHVLYARGATLFRLRVDPDRLEPIGQPTPAAQGVEQHFRGASQFGVSSGGVFAYLPVTTGTEVPRTLVWVDADGNEEPVGAPAGGYDRVRISPDGTKIAVARRVEREQSIWIWDAESPDTFQRRTYGEFDLSPAWQVDSSGFAFASTRPGTIGHDIYVASLDGSEDTSRLHSAEESLWPVDQMEDGRIVVHASGGALTSWDVMLLDPDSDTLEPILDSEFNETSVRLSPAGGWLAYASDESGQNQVYIRKLPGPSGRWPVSPPGGKLPAWSPDGSVLYYEYQGWMWAASLQLDAAAPTVERRRLFSAAPYLMPSGLVPYDIHPDTGRFLMIRTATDPESTPQIVVVLNWFEELERHSP